MLTAVNWAGVSFYGCTEHHSQHGAPQCTLMAAVSRTQSPVGDLWSVYVATGSKISWVPFLNHKPGASCSLSSFMIQGHGTNRRCLSQTETQFKRCPSDTKHETPNVIYSSCAQNTTQVTLCTGIISCSIDF